MLEAIIVGIVAGVFSGALGSVLGPYIWHRLSRSQRKELRTEQRHKELRAMLEDRMRRAHGHSVAIFDIRVLISTGMPPNEAFMESLRRQAIERSSTPHLVWRPHRIDDEKLRSLAIQLADLDREMFTARGEVSRGDVDDWSKRMTEMEKQLNELMEQIDNRLDELAW